MATIKEIQDALADAIDPVTDCLCKRCTNFKLVQNALYELEDLREELKRKNEVLEWYARPQFEKRPPDPDCPYCVGKGSYRTTSYHNGDWLDVTCQCIGDGSIVKTQNEYRYDYGKRARAALSPEPALVTAAKKMPFSVMVDSGRLEPLPPPRTQHFETLKGPSSTQSWTPLTQELRKLLLNGEDTKEFYERERASVTRHLAALDAAAKGTKEDSE